MQTDWKLVRSLMNTAIDACESLEAMGYEEQHRDLKINESGASVHDFVVSAWTLAEMLRYRVIRTRHEQDADLPSVQDSSRILIAMAQLVAELVKARATAPAEDELQGMILWYGMMLPQVEAAIGKACASTN